MTGPYRLVGFEAGSCDCTGPECAKPWVEVVDGGCRVHGLDDQPERQWEVGNAYVDLVNTHVHDAWRRSVGLLPPEMPR